MKALIVEDSPLAREDLIAMLSSFPECDVIGEAENIDQANDFLQSLEVDLIFLDIHLPGGSGFELLDGLNQAPAIIFVTAFSEHAIESFDYNTIDYLIKPVHPRLLKRAIDKAQRYLSAASQGAQDSRQINPEALLEMDSRIFLKQGEHCQLVNLSDISYFEVDGNHTRVHYQISSSLATKALSQIEARLPTNYFFRANRQQIVNVKKIDQIDPWINGGYRLTMTNGNEVVVSRRNCALFSELFSL